MSRLSLLIGGLVGIFLVLFALLADHPWFGPTAVAQQLDAHRTVMLPLGWALMIGDLILPVPATVVVATFGWQWGVLRGALAGAVGSTLASLTAYGLCRAMGHRAAERLAGTEGLQRMEGFFRRWGIVAVALSRSLPILPETISCLAGLSRMPLGQFLLGSIVGAAPMALCFAWIGAWGKVTDEPGWSLAISAGLPVLVIIPVTWILRARASQDSPNGEA